ncbi:hypothetical protein HK405_014747 [Cladochytrium tenue]|nr:hypothetical protein HK405_014747 [Cladochytrium tenue]
MSESLLPTPPLEALTSFAPDAKLSIPPALAAQLLAAVEQKLHSELPHLVPTVERLRAKLREASASAGTVNTPAMSPPTVLSDRAVSLPPKRLSSSASSSASPSAPPFMDSASASPEIKALDEVGQSYNVPMPPGTDMSAFLSQLAAAYDVPPGAEIAFPVQLVRGANGQLRPKLKVGRKRKERPDDPEVIQREMDRKRERNTEAARRSRQRRLAELDLLKQEAIDAQAERDLAMARAKELEEELEKARMLLLVANAQLATAGIQPVRL